MTFTPGADAEELRVVVREFLDKHSPEEAVRAAADSSAGFDAAVWRQAAQELGLQGLAIPEIYGGAGATPVEVGIAFEEMGAALYCAPFLSTVGLAATALIGCDEQAVSYLKSIAADAITATLAWAGPRPAESSLLAHGIAGEWRVTGAAPIVIDGAHADLVLVAAQTPSGPGLFAVSDATGLTRTVLTTLDTTRKLGRLEFDAVRAEPLALGATAGLALNRTADLAILYLAAEQLGGAARTLQSATNYARTRVQFGRSIGSFQAIKHRLADMLAEVESARSAVYHGLWTATNDLDALPVAAALAGSVASDAFQHVAAHNIQIHGGVGFTWEHNAHLYLKRAKSSQLLLGAPRWHRSRLASLLCLAGEVAPLSERGSHEVVASPPAGADALDGAIAEFLKSHPVPDQVDEDRAFREARFDAGLAIVHAPKGFGGRALDSSLQPFVDQRFEEAGARDHFALNVIGLGMAIPTIIAHGTDEQKRRLLRPCFTGEEIWCQLFSEPGAGSDLASLATRAVADGDHFIVRGQKIWTSLAHVASWGLLLARTDPDVPKHKGLTYFVLDMHSPGVEVRPLRQLTGEAEFNEVFLDNVRVPARNIIGEVGGGWQVAMTTLANERVSLGGRVARRGEGPIGQAVKVYRAAVASGRISADDTLSTERLMVLWTQAEAARLTNLRAAATAGGRAGPEGSIAKLQMAELNKAIYELCVDFSGDAALLIDDYTETRPVATAVHGAHDVRKAYLRSLANSIEGGTSEVLRNIVGERVLGLPGEPRVDRDIPWKDLRRS